MGRKSKRSSEAHFLDTSVLIKLLHYDEVEAAKIISRIAPTRRSAAYYSLIEFNCGFMSACIHMYRTVEDVQDVAQAIADFTNNFGREPKYGGLLLATMMRLNKIINTTDYLSYLDMMEVAIINLHRRTVGLIHQFVGHYAKHTFAEIRPESRIDFSAFPRANQRPNPRPDLADIWQDYTVQLNTFVEHLDELKKNRKLVNDEQELEKLAKSALADPTNVLSSKFRGDLAIALESPKKHKVVAYDRIFDRVVPLLDKNGGYVEQSQFRNS